MAVDSSLCVCVLLLTVINHARLSVLIVVCVLCC